MPSVTLSDGSWGEKEGGEGLTSQASYLPNGYD